MDFNKKHTFPQQEQNNSTLLCSNQDTHNIKSGQGQSGLASALLALKSRRSKVSKLRQVIFLLSSALVKLEDCIHFWASVFKRTVKRLAGISRRLSRWSGV